MSINSKHHQLAIIISMFFCVFFQTGGEFLAREQKFLGQPPLNLTFLEYSQYCYDATWMLAYALNNTLNSKYPHSVNEVANPCIYLPYTAYFKYFAWERGNGCSF